MYAVFNLLHRPICDHSSPSRLCFITTHIFLGYLQALADIFFVLGHLSVRVSSIWLHLCLWYIRSLLLSSWGWVLQLCLVSLFLYYSSVDHGSCIWFSCLLDYCLFALLVLAQTLGWVIFMPSPWGLYDQFVCPDVMSLAHIILVLGPCLHVQLVLCLHKYLLLVIPSCYLLCLDLGYFQLGFLALGWSFFNCVQYPFVVFPWALFVRSQGYIQSGLRDWSHV